MYLQVDIIKINVFALGRPTVIFGTLNIKINVEKEIPINNIMLKIWQVPNIKYLNI